MDQQSHYYGKHNTLNYQTSFASSDTDYQATAYNDSSHQNLHHPTGINFNGSSIGGASNLCNNDPSGSSIANYSRSTNCNNLSANQSTATEYNNGAVYNRLYSYMTSENPISNTQNASSTASNASNCNNISSYGATYNNSSKSYDTTTNSAHVPVIAVTSSNSSIPTNYHHSNINYGSYQNVDYSLHKAINQNYSSSAVMPTPNQNRSSINSIAATTATSFQSSNNPIDRSVHSSTKNRSSGQSENKLSAKTSVIKPLNEYSNATATAINYTKYAASYPAAYTNNNKSAANLDKLSSSNSSNRGMFATNNNTTSTHKNTEVYCPEPISARYANPNYTLSVTSPATAHTNSHFLASNNYHLGYGHHLSQHQSTVHHHSRNLLQSSGYQMPLDETATVNYFNRQNGIFVRPTPNAYKQCQMPYQNAYCYGRSSNSSSNNTANNTANSSHSTLPKPQSQKTINEPINSAFDGSYDRRHLRQYSSMYGSNYIDSNTYDEYQQYSGFASHNVHAASFYQPKTSPKNLYNYNSGLNVAYNNSNNTNTSQLTPQNIQSVISSTSSIPVTTTTTTTIVQQPVPINPNATQLISSNYDTSSLHSILPSALFNSTTTNQYQQNSYTPTILYPTPNYLPSVKSNLPAVSLANHVASNEKIYSEKLIAPAAEKYSSIDLEEQINSSKILKHSRTCSKIPTNHHLAEMQMNRTNGNQMKNPTPLNINANNKNQYVYNYNAYNNCYQQQQHPQNWHKPNLTNSSLSTPSVHMHPKKQSLRDFLSTWNEFEEEEADSGLKIPIPKAYIDLTKNESSKPLNYEKRDKHREKTAHAIVQPIPQLPQPSQLQSQLQSSPMGSAFHELPISNAQIVPPKIHVGITVNNGNNSVQNLPDIIIDIEKPKVAGEGECFERANVIQEAPKASDKLYILDSIDVPLSDLSKYRHLSVVNKLPDNIVLPSPPPLRHEKIHEDNVTESLKFIDEVETSQSKFFKNDFELNVDYYADIVECKNISVVHKVRKIIKKYRKQREYMRKTKAAAQQTQQVSTESNSSLSTPLKSLSPVQDFDNNGATDSNILSVPCPVDLSINSNKESVDEFIDNFSICSDDDGSEFDLSVSVSPLAEIMQLTASPELNDNINGIEKLSNGVKNIEENESKNPHAQEEEKVNKIETESKITEKVEVATADQKKDEIQPTENMQTEEIKLNVSKTEVKSLQYQCVRTMNGEDFREYFTKTVLSVEVKNEIESIQKNGTRASVCILAKNEENEIIDVDEISTEKVADETPNDIVDPVVEPIVSKVPSLRSLAREIVLNNQYNLSLNLKSLKIIYDYETERKTTDILTDSNLNRVKTLQELAREVANTIYSFNVKPLHDICKLAIEKYNHIYLVNRMETLDDVGTHCEKEKLEICDMKNGNFPFIFLSLMHFEKKNFFLIHFLFQIN